MTTERVPADGEYIENAVSRTLAEVDGRLELWIDDLRHAAKDGLSDSDEAAESVAVQASLRAMTPALAKLYDAGRRLIDALGGQTIDWLNAELVALEDAIVAIEKAPDPKPEPAAGPTL